MTERGHWYAAEEDWLDEEDAPADCFHSFRTKKGQLSVWLINSSTDLNRALACLAGNRDKLARLDYILMSVSGIEELNLPVRKSDGATPDAGFNISNHFDLEARSGSSLLSLAVYCTKLMRDGFVPRKTKADVKALLKDSLGSSFLSQDKMKFTVL